MMDSESFFMQQHRLPWTPSRQAAPIVRVEFHRPTGEVLAGLFLTNLPLSPPKITISTLYFAPPESRRIMRIGFKGHRTAHVEHKPH